MYWVHNRILESLVLISVLRIALDSEMDAKLIKSTILHVITNSNVVWLGHLNGSLTNLKLITMTLFKTGCHCSVRYFLYVNDSGEDPIILYSNSVSFFRVHEISHWIMVSFLSLPVKLILKLYLHRGPSQTQLESKGLHYTFKNIILLLNTLFKCKEKRKMQTILNITGCSDCFITITEITFCQSLGICKAFEMLYSHQS